MKSRLLLGDEAVAQAAMDAGISTAYAYPGTPSTETFEYIERIAPKKLPHLHVSWCANEKVAYEAAMGTSFAGRRTVITMKHVGLNVAADPFMNSAMTGADGGTVLMVADDPSMHSSQNEQDSRYFADFAKLPCYEPANQQEAYDMTREAFDTSERFKLPITLRIVTRLAHSRARVVTQPAREPNPLALDADKQRWTLLPTNSRRNYKVLLEKQVAINEFSNESQWNELVLTKNKKLGVITAGVAYNYFREVFAGEPADELPSYLKIGVYPMPMDKIEALLAHVDEVLILEEGYPYIERNLLGELGIAHDPRFKGRFSGQVPMDGELDPDVAARAFGREAPVAGTNQDALVKARPPQLCPGCPHGDTFHAMNDVRADFGHSSVFADIGCYTLGFYEPFGALESCLDMGASISMAKGAADAGIHPVMCVIGDSTFGHSGITPLLTAAHENTNMVVFILDNGTVAMTGTQESMSTGDRLDAIIEGVGVPKEHIRIIRPLPKNREENARIIREEIAYEGLSVIVPRRACVQDKKAMARMG